MKNHDSDSETITGFTEYIGQHSKTREDIKTWFNAIELDDYAVSGAKSDPSPKTILKQPLNRFSIKPKK